MSKKKKNKKYLYERSVIYDIDKKSKKSINKEFDSTIDEIRDYQLRLYEIDKLSNKRQIKKINKSETEFYTKMDAIKVRKRMSKKWEKCGFLDTVIHILQQAAPIVKIIAKMISILIINFLSLEPIKKIISPNVLNKLTKIYDIAMCV